ncbi:hypothetical protein BaRGS_00022770 [Batillaria attramentaria]|uniref:Glutathione S-transferase n=1 Tax=Batillaria attramentaria TaxID=370345 RepID=A0ABD0KG45_9CAEN
MSDIKLYYFSHFGRGEICRLVLAASGVQWEDIRFTAEQWRTKYKKGLAGTTKLETARVEEIVQLEQEFFNNYLVKVLFEKDHARKVELLDKLKKEDIPRYFNHFEKLLEDNGTGYFVGHQLTLADIAVYDAVVNHVQTVLHVHDADHEQYPEVLALCDKVEANPNIQKYLEQQRD